MNVTHFAGKVDGNPKDIQRTNPQRYLEFNKEVNKHQDEIGAMNCDLRFKKKYSNAIKNISGDEYFRLTAKPEGTEQELAELQRKGFKYTNGVKYKHPTIGKQGVISTYVNDVVAFAKRYGDALKKPSPYVSPFLIHQSGLEDYEQAKKAFADVLGGEHPQIVLPEGTQVKLTRKKQLRITIPQAGSKPFVQTLKFDPDTVRQENQHSQDPDAQAGNWLAVFVKNGLEYAKAVSQDLAPIQQPVVHDVPQHHVQQHEEEVVLVQGHENQ